MPTPRSGPAVEVTGARELRAALRRMGESLGDLKDTHRAAGELVSERARSIVPHVSGRLGKSIRLSVRKSGVSVLAGRMTVPYAPPIHFGWPRRNIRPQPFLYDALDDRREAVARVYSQRVGALVARVGRETP